MKSLIMLFGFLIFGIPLFTQESFRIEWEINEDTTPLKSIVDNDGNVVVVGVIRKPEQNYDGDGFIFKMTPEGDYSYYRYFGNTDSTLLFQCVTQLENGNYIVVGTYGLNDLQVPNHVLRIFVFDQFLNLLNDKQYELPEEYIMFWQPISILEPYGNVLVAGSIRSQYQPGVSMDDLALLRLSDSGDTLETRYIDYPFNVIVYDIDKIPGSPNYLILEAVTQGYGSFECYILKPDLTAESIEFWYDYDFNLNYANTTDYWNEDKTFLMAAEMFDYSKAAEKGVGIARFDTLANIHNILFINKEGIFNQVSHKQAMAYADEMEIYAASFDVDYGNCLEPDSMDLYVVDTSLNMIGHKSFGGDMSYETFGVLTAKDGGAIVYGKAMKMENDTCRSNLVVYYFSRKDLGLVTKVIDREAAGTELPVYPNPAHNIINISVNKPELTKTSVIKIFNNRGKKVYDYKLPNSGNTIQIDIHNLEKGMYIFEISNNNRIINKGKFIKQ